MDTGRNDAGQLIERQRPESRISLPLMARSRVSLISLGFAATVSQAVLLREGMAALGGSELSWTVVMTLWLVSMAVGARLGAHTRIGSLGEAAPFLVVVLSMGGAILLRAAPALAAAAPGEAAAGWAIPWVWLAAVVPAAALGGWAFPALASGLTSAGPARAYAMEAAGALLGGLLFTFALAPLGSAAALIGTAALCLAVALRCRPWLAGLVLLACAAAAWPSGGLLARAEWRWAKRGGRVIAWRETHHERLELGSGPPLTLYGDGRLLATYPDPWQVSMRGNLLMLLHPDPERVLAVGGVADGTIDVLLRHPLRELMVVSDDPELPGILSKWYGGGLERGLRDPRVTVCRADPVRAVSREGRWDLILLLDPDPATLRANRTRTAGFFRRCREALAPGGRLVVHVGVSDVYRGGAAGRLLEVLSSTLRSAFPYVAGIPGDQVLLVAGEGPLADDLDPAVLAARWKKRGVSDPIFVPEVLPILVPRHRARDLTGFLDRSRAPVNRAQRPEAVLPAMARVEGRGQRQVVRFLLDLAHVHRDALDVAGGVAVLAVLLIGLGSRRRSGEVVAGAAGAAAMGWWFLLLASWQASRGSVYGEIGALSAAFMGGAAAGALFAARWKEPQRKLPVLLIAGSLLSAVIATPAALTWPMPLVPALLAAGGAIAGAIFPGAARFLGGAHVQRASGRGFSADELGAAAGALLAGTLLPVAGNVWLAVLLAGILAAAAVTVVIPHRSSRRGERWP
ncbi:MAG: hypothetical protein GWP10_16510 [Nitrospiraceae bacterium]|nr:hypothetical protein [Nitrospiraceae bacterium]